MANNRNNFLKIFISHKPSCRRQTTSKIRSQDSLPTFSISMRFFFNLIGKKMMAQFRDCDRYACREQEKCSDMVNMFPKSGANCLHIFRTAGRSRHRRSWQHNRNVVPNCSRNILSEVHPCLQKKG